MAMPEHLKGMTYRLESELKSLSAFMEELEVDLTGLALKSSAVRFAIEILRPIHFDLWSNAEVSQELSRSICAQWPVDEWLLQCFRTHCDPSIMSVDGHDRTTPCEADPEDPGDIGVAMAAGCLMVKILADKPMQEIVAASADMFACAHLHGAKYGTAIFDACGLREREGAVDEFAVEVGMLMSQIEELKARPLAEKLQAVLGWEDYDFNIFFEEVARARDSFAQELRPELEAAIQEAVAAGNVDVVAAALLLREGLTAEAARSLAAWHGFELSGKEPMDYAERLERDFDTTPYAIEALQERFTEWSDQMFAFGFAGAGSKKSQKGEMGLLKRWCELAPADLRLPMVLAKMSGGYSKHLKRRLHLFGLDELVLLLPADGKD